jgi:pyridoxamine 5'-phosphate oxidase
MKPLNRFLNWYQKAVKAGENIPEAMALATATKNGRPSNRFVLFKGVEKDSLEFFTNYRSPKSKDLDENPYAELVVFWPKIYLQVRISGRVRLLSAAKSDRYWATRPRESQIGAWASPQSSVIASRALLEKRVKEFTKRFEGVPVPRPAHWGGYSLSARSVEFWTGQNFRLHQRERFLKKNGRWIKQLIAP